MSQQLEVDITCPNCGTTFTGNLFRTIWGEFPENRDLVMNDQINVVKCDGCGEILKIPMPFMYTNAEQTFAVWWEPEYDPQIDSDTEAYKVATGDTSYFSTAPRVSDWDEFKETIIKFEKGILKGNPVDPLAREKMFDQFFKNKEE